MKTYKISIEGEKFDLDLVTLKTMLTETAFILFKKVVNQGGRAEFTFNAIRKEFINGQV